MFRLPRVFDSTREGEVRTKLDTWWRYEPTFPSPVRNINLDGKPRLLDKRLVAQRRMGSESVGEWIGVIATIDSRFLRTISLENKFLGCCRVRQRSSNDNTPCLSHLSEIALSPLQRKSREVRNRLGEECEQNDLGQV